MYLLYRVAIVNVEEGKTAYELWTKKRPYLEHARAFGMVTYTHIPKMFTKKFYERAKMTYLVGYEKDSNNYRVYNDVTGKLTISRNMVFSDVLGNAASPNVTDEHLEIELNQLQKEPKEKVNVSVNEEKEAAAEGGVDRHNAATACIDFKFLCNLFLKFE